MKGEDKEKEIVSRLRLFTVKRIGKKTGAMSTPIGGVGRVWSRIRLVGQDRAEGNRPEQVTVMDMDGLPVKTKNGQNCKEND
jgi:hypothetical protein